jgi:hypothetical protein
MIVAALAIVISPMCARAVAKTFSPWTTAGSADEAGSAVEANILAKDLATLCGRHRNFLPSPVDENTHGD